jgi:hypothetical protein
MERQNKIDKFMSSALDKMFQSVGFDGFDEEFAKQDNWYLLREWTNEQQSEYKDWFISECSKKLRMRKSQAEREFGFFLLSWGWKTVG